MALTWNWNKKMGECIYENGTKVNLYLGNALVIAIKENEDETYELNWFFADNDHTKNILGLAKGHENIMKDWGIKKIRFDVRYEKVPKLVSLFARAKMEMEIELYIGEEPKA